VETITTKMPLVLINNIGYSYPNGTVALKNISLNISKGELIGIMGSNGAGKTTLIRTLNGLIRPSEGHIYINGESIKTKTIALLSKNVGLIFQNPLHQLFSNTVEEEIRFSLKNLDLSKKELQDRIEKIIELFNLEKYRDRSPLNLSGGEAKKLAIASIICRYPDILVFDEPTLGQDAKEIEFFINLIKNEMNYDKTIIIITHNIEFAIEHIPRIVLMAEGNIIADGPTHELLNNEFLIKKAHLILPQVRRFRNKLQNIGIQLPNDINSKIDMQKFLIDYFKSNIDGGID